jgi:hypothetical protein
MTVVVAVPVLARSQCSVLIAAVLAKYVVCATAFWDKWSPQVLVVDAEAWVRS